MFLKLESIEQVTAARRMGRLIVILGPFEYNLSRVSRCVQPQMRPALPSIYQTRANARGHPCIQQT
jgi:hypothetical protein